jgi:dolichol-phosphate mannosyltransferase
VRYIWSRAVLSRGGNAHARLMPGVPLRDATGGYRAFRAAALEKIRLDTVDLDRLRGRR